MSGKKETKYNMFKCITSCLSRTYTPPVEDLQRISPFIFKRWLSNHPTGIIIANLFNIYQNVPVECQYRFAKNVLKLKGRIKYIKYPKKENNEEEEHIINILQKHYKIGFNTAKQYYNTLPQEEIDKLVQMYEVHGLQKG